jgi:hypothetical protein
MIMIMRQASAANYASGETKAQKHPCATEETMLLPAVQASWRIDFWPM